jgi:hypothetical protein
MKQIRYRVIALICWVVLYCAIELLLEPLPLGGIPLSLGLSMTMIMLAIPRAVHIPWWMVVFAPFSLLLGLEVWAGKLARLVEVPLTILEAGGITVTLLRASPLGGAIACPKAMQRDKELCIVKCVGRATTSDRWLCWPCLSRSGLSRVPWIGWWKRLNQQ